MDRAAADTSALILPVQLPAQLEALRRAHDSAGREGVPAHITLMYPFLRPEVLSEVETDTLRATVASHAVLRVRLSGPASWPDVLYAAVQPEQPVQALQRDLEDLYPDLPIYGGGFQYVPHVTVADGEAGGSPELTAHDAWSVLPVEIVLDSVDLIARDERAWRRYDRFSLGESAGPGA